MKFFHIAFVAAVSFLLWASSDNSRPALASSGFIGTWCPSGSAIHPYTIIDFPRLMIKRGLFEESSAHYSGSQLVAERWGQTGTLTSGGGKIVWSDGNYWVRTNNGAEGCGIFARATATPKPYRYLKWASDVGPRPPIGYVDTWAAIMNNGTMVYACVSFKNENSVAATRVRFTFPLTSGNGQLIDTAKLDRKGEFSPNVEIHGWNDLAAWWGGQGHRGYYDNCVRWQPDTEEERKAYMYIRHYSVHTERMDFADGTTWPSAAESPSP
jgi:hypothetical protein